MGPAKKRSKRPRTSDCGLLLLLGSLLIGRVDSAAGEVLLVHSLHAHHPESMPGHHQPLTLLPPHDTRRVTLKQALSYGRVTPPPRPKTAAR